MGKRLHNAYTWAKIHKPELLGVAGGVLGVAAVGTSIYCTHKWGSNDYVNLKKTRKNLKQQQTAGEISIEEYRRESAKSIAKGVGKLALDYAIPAACEAGSLVCFGLAGNTYRTRIAEYATAAASATATIAMMKDNILEKYGEEALKEVQKIPAKKKVKKSDEKGKQIEIEEPCEDPGLLCIDSRAYEDSIKYGMPYSPTRIRIDERFPVWNTFGGDIHNMLPVLQTSLKMSRDQMWNNGWISVWDILQNINLMPGATDTINKSMALRYGIIDQPVAYDMVLKKEVKVPGFTKHGKEVVADRPDGLDLSHKTISLGTVVDAMLEDPGLFEVYMNNPSTCDDIVSVDETDGKEYLYIDIVCDGDISNFRLDEQPKARKISAWHQHPETQQ